MTTTAQAVSEIFSEAEIVFSQFNSLAEGAHDFLIRKDKKYGHVLCTEGIDIPLVDWFDSPEEAIGFFQGSQWSYGDKRTKFASYAIFYLSSS